MQSLEARKNYPTSFHCAAKIFKDEGILTFWSGAMPRLARLILSGGIVFTMFVPLISECRRAGLIDAGTKKRWRRSTCSIRSENTYRLFVHAIT